MATVLLSYGGAQFFSPVKGQYSPSFDSLQRDTNFTWPAQQRVNRDPAHQFTGPGEDNVTIDGILYPHLFGGQSTLEQLRALGRAGAPHPLIRYTTNVGFTAAGPSPDGAYIAAAYVLPSTWVLKRVQHKETFINSQGKTDRIEFTLEFSRYGDDGFNSLQIGGGGFGTPNVPGAN